MQLSEAFKLSARLMIATSSHKVIILVSFIIALLSYLVRETAASSLVPLLATISGLTIIEYGKQTIKQVFYLMILSGALPKQLNMLKLLYSLTISTPLTLSTISTEKIELTFLTFLLLEVLAIGLLSYYLRKVKSGL